MPALAAIIIGLALAWAIACFAIGSLFFVAASILCAIETAGKFVRRKIWRKA